jgi:N-acyl-phosphatidylethanolamine-hydrolysing phospholipase D
VTPFDVVPFLLRRVKVSLLPRPGAAARAAFDPAALALDPSATWIGHATVLVRLDGASFLTDPVFSGRVGPLGLAGPPRLVAPGVPLADLPRIDFALVSHDHYDHADLPTVRALAARGVRVVVPRGLGSLVRAAGAEAVELAWWDSAEIAGVRVHCVPAQHFSGRGVFDRNRRLWAGFVVEGRSRRFYHAGDTGYFAGLAEIGRRLGHPDLAAVPIGAYEPRAVMRHVHLTPEEAVQAALDVGAVKVLGMHWGTFDLADEPLDEPPRRFLAEAARRGLRGAFVPRVGETRGF